jgi:hypothetical protein
MICFVLTLSLAECDLVARFEIFHWLDFGKNWVLEEFTEQLTEARVGNCNSL